MSDIGVAEIPVDEDERPLPPPKPPARNALLDGPILPTLLSLAWPNIMAFSAATCVVIAETSYIGRLGVESLAAIALVFPCVMLTMTMSGGAMGGGVASAIARALGAGGGGSGRSSSSTGISATPISDISAPAREGQF